jgi:FAD/FMN-containing dehydrogenase
MRFAREHGAEIAANAGLISRWAPRLLAGTAPNLSGRRVHQLHDGRGQDRIKASYRGNYDRLTEVKRRYDPGSTFHINQNIQPASEPGP